MKRITIIICALTAICMTICAQQKQKEYKKTKTLVAYFSATGVTKAAAEKLAEVTGSDIYVIQPKVPYTDADLNWHNKKSRSSVEMADPTSRPAIKGKVEKLNDYDTVFIGYPIWWNTAPRIINTFIEANNLKGKTVVPFCTSGSSSIKNSAEELKKAYPSLKWKDGKRLKGISKKELQSWIKGM